VLALLESSKKLVIEPYNARAFRTDLNCVIQTAHATAVAAELDMARLESVLLEMLAHLGHRKNKSLIV
jgi:hypothetical protein